MKRPDKYEFDVSVVLTLHHEAVYVARTLRSLSEAASYALQCGLRVELVIVFDRSDDTTRATTEAADKFGFERVTSIKVDHGSPGSSRNSGIAVASGEYVWLSDADDLASFNCIERMHLVAQTEEKVAIFPEYTLAFGVDYWVNRYFDDSVVETTDFVYGHPYNMRLFIRRDAFENLQCADISPLSKGFAYEDWHLNCELRAHGYRFRIAPKTVYFYRHKREGSVYRQANAMSARQIPHSTLFDPDHFARTVEAERLARNDVDFLHRRAEARTCMPRDELLGDATCMELVAAAVQIDPGINLHMIERGGNGTNVFPDQHWGHSFFDVCRLVRSEKFTDVFLLPWLIAGGADRFILDVMTSLQDLEASANFLVISGESVAKYAKHTWLHKLPKQSVFLDLYNFFPSLSEDERDLLALRTILACGEGVRLHLKQSGFVTRIINKFSHCLGAFKAIFYRFSDQRYVHDGEVFALGWGFDFISNHLPQFELIVTDHERIAISDRRRFGLEQQKWQCLYAKHASKQPRGDVQPRMRLLWASRVCDEKRPEIVIGIASAASRLLPGISIDAYGAPENDVDISATFGGAEALRYKGAYLDFDELKPEAYDAFIYTTRFDGLPNVVIEAMSWGLPVIAPDVGGLAEAVMDGKTGYLLPDLQDDDAMCAAYAQAIQKLYQDWSATLAMGQAAQELIRQRHSPDAYRRRVAAIFLEEQTV